MKINTKIKDQSIFFESQNYFDLSIPIILNSPDSQPSQPSSFGVEPAESKPYKAGNFVGDTRQGSSVNFDKITIIPHCNSTHTECIGHITDERINFIANKRELFSIANLISVNTTSPSDTKETYSSKLEPSDKVITKASLSLKITECGYNYSSLIIRTLPNSNSKLSMDYSKTPAPFFTSEAMELLSSLTLDNILVDLPSLDKANDGGSLSNHRIWWGIEPNSKSLNGNPKNLRTISEFLYIDNNITDDIYLLDLQTANLSGDAVLSRPIIYPISR